LVFHARAQIKYSATKSRCRYVNPPRVLLGLIPVRLNKRRTFTQPVPGTAINKVSKRIVNA
jgi:hypothetical protein